MSKKERKRFAVIGLVIMLALGTVFYFVGEPLIDFVLYIISIILYWTIGGTIVLTVVGLVIFFFLSDKQIEWLCDDSKRTKREKEEAEVIEKFINECNERHKNEENNEEV